MRRLFSLILESLRQPSGIRGIILIVTGATGLNLADTQIDAIVSLGLSLSGLVGAFIHDDAFKAS